ncbi:MAG TPA: HlyD family efflux transporter periplasmic adaptor subunit [Thermoanaerobaculia bacterium]|jgi:HlyD family secretion protein|nr:HlyD family efflux transporter periplasmic adaptor subunit [Thermoanaerobaculia bacterium]
MDIVRAHRPTPFIRRTTILAGSGVAVAIALTSLGLRLKPAAPAIDRSAVLMDTVRRGPLVRRVTAMGTLTAQQVLWITAQTDGRIEHVGVLPGAPVTPDTVLLVLANPEVGRSALDADSEVRAAEANLTDIRVRFQSQLMDSQAAAAALASEMHQAQLQLGIDEKLASEGLTSNLVLELARTKAAELAARSKLATDRVQMAQRSVEAQVAAQQARVTQARALAALRRDDVQALSVHSRVAGVLQEMLVEPGQRVTAGTRLAKVADTRQLEAQLQVQQLQTRDLRVGQPAQIDTGHGTVPGHVTRINPAVQNGTVTVDIAFDQPPPPGARADQSVEGTIEIGRATDTLYVERPALAMENTTMGIFRLSPGSEEAFRIPVDFGAGSASQIEIRRGLAAGDRVILSDMSQWQTTDKVRLR